jgi:hypothetical protein
LDSKRISQTIKDFKNLLLELEVEENLLTEEIMTGVLKSTAMIGVKESLEDHITQTLNPEVKDLTSKSRETLKVQAGEVLMVKTKRIIRREEMMMKKLNMGKILKFRGLVKHEL